MSSRASTPVLPPPAPSNGFAIAGLALAIGSFVVPVVAPAVGVVMSALGMRRGRELEAAGVPHQLSRRTLASTALVLTISLLVIELAAFAVLWWALTVFANGGGFSG